MAPSQTEENAPDWPAALRGFAIASTVTTIIWLSYGLFTSKNLRSPRIGWQCVALLVLVLLGQIVLIGLSDDACSHMLWWTGTWVCLLLYFGTTIAAYVTKTAPVNRIALLVSFFVLAAIQFIAFRSSDTPLSSPQTWI